MNNEASNLEDQDLVRWLENKLGDPKELWGSEQAASLLNEQVLTELETCFQALEPHVKIKILQASLHLSSKLVQAWRDPLNNLLSLARRDADDWVELVADLMRDYPDQGCIQCFPSNKDSIFYKTLKELNQKLSEFVEQNPDVVVLPPQCEFMTKAAIKATYNVSPPLPKKHFTVTKKLKAEIMMEELLKQSAQMNEANSKKGGGIVSSIPMTKMRSTAKDLNNTLPMRGIPSANVNKFSGGFTNEPKKYQRQLTAREGGAKLIDISELPQHQPGKRRSVQTKVKNETTPKKASKPSGSAKEREPASQKKGSTSVKQEPADGSIMETSEVTLPSTDDEPRDVNPIGSDASSIGASVLTALGATSQSTLPASASDSLQSAYSLEQQQQNISVGASMLTTPEATSHSTSMGQNLQSAHSLQQQQQNLPISGEVQDVSTSLNQANQEIVSAPSNSQNVNIFDIASRLKSVLSSLSVNQNVDVSSQNVDVSSQDVVTSMPSLPNQPVPQNVNPPMNLQNQSSNLQIANVNMLLFLQRLLGQRNIVPDVNMPSSSSNTQNVNVSANLQNFGIPVTASNVLPLASDFPAASTVNRPRMDLSGPTPIVNAPIDLTLYLAAMAARESNRNFTSGLSGGMNAIQSAVQPIIQSVMPTIQQQSYASQTPQSSSIMQQSNMTNFGAPFAPQSSGFSATPQVDDETFSPEETELLGFLASESNVLSPGLHELVAAFIRGSRQNPYGPTAHPIVTFPLFDQIEYTRHPHGVIPSLVEFIFQMDYRTGAWKRLQRRRDLTPADMNTERIRNVTNRAYINLTPDQHDQMVPPPQVMSAINQQQQDLANFQQFMSQNFQFRPNMPHPPQ